jgi:hypothetical protein
MVLELAAPFLVPATSALFKAGLKDHFQKKEEAVQQILLAEMALGKRSLEDVAKDDKFIGGYYRILDAALKGAANSNLRRLSKILRNCMDENVVESDEINHMLSVIADLSEDEVWLLARLWKLHEETGMASRDMPISIDLNDKLIAEGYSGEIFKARMARLERTGFIISEPLILGGVAYNPSPLLEQFVKLAELEIYNNVKL